jgi:non-heme chloroperoxidase
MTGGEQRRASSQALRANTAVLPGGLRLPYVEQGDAAGLPVVLLHAFADSWRSFERVLEHLPSSMRAIAVSQRGHGDADRPATGYRVEDFASDLLALLDALALEAAVLVASSSASLTVQRFAVDHPERTLGLVFVGAPRSLRDKPSAAEFVSAVSALSDPVAPSFVAELLDATLARPLPPDFRATLIAENLKVPARVWTATINGLVDAAPAVETGTITVPTIIIWGDRDRFLPRSDQEALAAAIAGAQLVVYEGAGHAVHWEEPERVAADITALVNRLPRR